MKIFSARRKIFAGWIIFFLSVNVFNIYSQEENPSSLEDLLDDEMKKNPENSDEESSGILIENKWQFFGFFQNRNFFSANLEEDTQTLKTEGRINLNTIYGNSSRYVKVQGDVYVFPASDNNREEEAYAELRELYFSAGERLNFTLGKRVYQWGSADVFNVVNYMDRNDQRKLFATDKDDRYTGVYSAAVKFIFSEFSIETVAVPYFAEPYLPEDEWKIEMPNYSTPMGMIPMEIQDSSAKSNEWRNASYAARFGGTIEFFDFHLTYFNGISKNFIFYPELEKTTVMGLPSFKINTSPQYKRVQSAGLDFAFTWDKLSIRTETSYTYNMPAVKEIDTEKFTGMNPFLMSDGVYALTEMDRNQYLSYTIGMDYNLWGNNGRVLMEWMEGYYLIHRQDYAEPFLNRLLVFRVEDKWLNERLYGEIGTIVRPIIKNPGYGILYKLGWDFKNGLTIETEGYFFYANDDDFFSVLEKKDMVAVSAKMTY